MAFREDSNFQLVKGPARYSSQPFLPTELSSSSPSSQQQQQQTGFHLGNNVLDFAAASSMAKAAAAAKLPKPPPPTASKSQLDRLNYKVIRLDLVVNAPRSVNVTLSCQIIRLVIYIYMGFKPNP